MAESNNTQKLLEGFLDVLAGRSTEEDLCREFGVLAHQLNDLRTLATQLAARKKIVEDGDSRLDSGDEELAAETNVTSEEADRDTVVRARDIKKVFRMGKEEVQALRGVNLQVFRGEYMSLMGPSGSGKTTLFNMLGALDRPSSGHVYIDEVDVAQLTASELAWLRCRKIGYIFQTFNIIPVMTALENVTLPMIFADIHPDLARERGVQLLKRVGLGNRVMHKPFELSGGQQQRVAIARALANDPAILLADEPTGNLDLNTGEEIIFLLKELSQEEGVTVITATHDMKMLSASDRIVWIRDGRVDRVENRKDLNIEVGSLH